MNDVMEIFAENLFINLMSSQNKNHDLVIDLSLETLHKYSSSIYSCKLFS